MPIQTFPFTTPSNYTFDTDKVEITGGKAQLKLINNPGNDFQEDFANDTDFTYDSDLAEFSGGQVQQKNKRPANGILYAPFSSDGDAAWTEIGTGVGTLSDGATVHDGLLDLTGYVANRRLSIEAYNTSHNSQKGCMRCRFKPNYSGAPSQLQYIMQWRDGGLENNIQVLQNTSRFMQAWIRDGDGNNILATASFGVVDFVADQIYEIEFNWDCDTGEHRMFIDGVQQGATQSGTGTRDSRVDQFDFGVYYNNVGQPDFSILDFIYFDDVQHTTDYTPDWSDIYEYDYVESEVVLPEMEYTGAGTLIAVTAFTTSFGGFPRLTLEIGRSGEELYWNGSAWAVSNETYAQATDPATFAANIASLPVNGEIYGQFKIYFTNSFSQSSFADLLITLTAQIYPIDNPTVEINSKWYLDDLEAFTETATKSGNDEIKYILKKGSTWYWFNVGTLEESDGTYSQANTAAEIETYKASLTSSKVYFGVKAFLHSNDGSTTPDIDSLVIQYSYAGDVPDSINTCVVWGTKLDNEGNADQTPFKVYHYNNFILYKDSTILERNIITVTPDASGYWDVELVENENMNGSQGYVFQWNKHTKHYKVVPNEESAIYNDLVDFDTGE